MGTLFQGETDSKLGFTPGRQPLSKENVQSHSANDGDINRIKKLKPQC